MSQYIRDSMDMAMKVRQYPQPQGPSGGPQLSVLDELAKIGKLKEQGVIADAEFQQMKHELMKRLC